MLFLLRESSLQSALNNEVLEILVCFLFLDCSNLKIDIGNGIASWHLLVSKTGSSFILIVNCDNILNTMKFRFLRDSRRQLVSFKTGSKILVWRTLFFINRCNVILTLD